MKDEIRFSQRAAIEAGLHTRYKIDVIDLTVLNAFVARARDELTEQFMSGGTMYYQISWVDLAADLPIVQIGSRRGWLKRIEKLTVAKLIKAHPENQTRQRSFFAISKTCEQIFSVNDHSHIRSNLNGSKVSDDECEQGFTGLGTEVHTQADRDAPVNESLHDTDKVSDSKRFAATCERKFTRSIEAEQRRADPIENYIYKYLEIISNTSTKEQFIKLLTVKLKELHAREAVNLADDFDALCDVFDLKCVSRLAPLTADNWLHLFDRYEHDGLVRVIFAVEIWGRTNTKKFARRKDLRAMIHAFMRKELSANPTIYEKMFARFFQQHTGERYVFTSKGERRKLSMLINLIADDFQRSNNKKAGEGDLQFSLNYLLQNLPEQNRKPENYKPSLIVANYSNIKSKIKQQRNESGTTKANISREFVANLVTQLNGYSEFDFRE